jgi:polysaccharide biosynthesis transport protein
MDYPRQLKGHDSHENHEVMMRPHSGYMLNARAYPDVAVPKETDDLTLVMQYVRVLWKHKRMMGISVLLGGLVALIVSLMMTPMYRARTSIEVQNIQEPFSTQRVTAQDPTLLTHAQLLQTGPLLDRTIEKLNVKPQSQIQVRGPLVSLRRLLHISEPAEATSWSTALLTASATVTVTNPRDSRVLVIQSDSPNPQAAASFANALAQQYVESTKEQRWESYETTSDWMSRAQQDLKAKVEESERRLAEFAKSKGLVMTGGSQNISEDRLLQIQQELLRASADRITKQSVYESSLSNPNESLPSVLDSGPMAQYQAKIADLRRELAELSATLTPAHYRSQRVKAQIEELEAARERERTNIISRIKIEYDSAAKRETELRREFARQSSVLSNQSDDLIQYNILLREAETNKKLYESALQQGKEASVASAMRTSNVRVIDPALVPRAARRPNLPVNLALGILGGLFCGAIGVVISSRMDASVQSPGLFEAQLNLRELGVIPAATTDPAIKALLTSPREGSPKRLLGQSENEPADCLELVTWRRKPSIISEAFRSTMTSILFSGENGDRPRVLVITSASPQEGKSTVVTNLAIALAEINKRVLIIDGDMRLPRLHNVFNVSNAFGLTDILHERKPIHEYVEESLIKKTHIPDLYVLPAGPARTNLSRLLHSTRMKDLVTRFRNTFDMVLIDSAPVLNVPDARILARSSDAVVLVIRAHRTAQDAALAAANCFVEDGRRILGTILNDWNPKMSTYGPYTMYNAYYSRYLNIQDEA